MRFEDGKCITIKEKENFDVSTNDICVTPDGKKVLYGSINGKVRIAQINDGILVREMKIHKDWIASVYVTPDGKYVVSGSGDSTIRITRISDGKLVYKLKNHASEVTSVYVTPDGKYVVSGSADKTVCINLCPTYAQNVNLCRQWARILLRDQMPKLVKKRLTQLLVYFQGNPGLLRYVGIKLMLCVFNV